MMDPIIVNRLAVIRQQEFLEQVNAEHSTWLWQIRHQVNIFLVTLGKRLVNTPATQSESSFRDEQITPCLQHETGC